MKSLIFLSLFLSSVSADSFLKKLFQREKEKKPKHCKVQDAPVSGGVSAGPHPNFFYKIDPSGEFITYIKGHKWGWAANNVLIERSTNKRMRLPGEIDPVISPDGDLLTVPGGGCMEFFDFNQVKEHLRNSPLNSEPKFSELSPQVILPVNDPKKRSGGHCIYGVYQSIGKQSDGSYRIVTDSDGFSVTEFKKTKRGIEIKEASKTGCVEGYYIQGKKVEGFRAYEMSLPMISKDGRTFSFYDRSSKTTKIANFDGDKCHEVLDLKVATGKVEFSYDNSQLTFHIGAFDPIHRGYFSGISAKESKDVVVATVEVQNKGKPSESWSVKGMDRLTFAGKKGTGGYYPVFDRDGNVFYLGRKRRKGHYFFARVKKKDIDTTTPLELLWPEFGEQVVRKSCEEGDSLDLRLSVIGGLWSLICEDSIFDGLGQNLQFARSLSKNQCQSFVREEWNKEVEERLFDQLVPRVDGKGQRGSLNREIKMRMDGLNQSVVETLLYEINLEDLLAACEGLDDHAYKINIDQAGRGDESKNRDKKVLNEPEHGERVFIQSCTNCHAQPMEHVKLSSFTDASKINSESLEKMKSAVSSGFMPLGSKLSLGDKEALIDYLEKLPK